MIKPASDVFVRPGNQHQQHLQEAARHPVIMPPKVKIQVGDDENWRAAWTGPRMARFNQCHYWLEWRLVVEKGAL
jgi:hypothetical protein